MSQGSMRRIVLFACLLVPGCTPQHWGLPHLARAIYYKKKGQESRGEKYISQVTETQLVGMNEAFAEALKDLHTCVALDPKPTLAHGHARAV
jgi:hypothetical protein